MNIGIDLGTTNSALAFVDPRGRTRATRKYTFSRCRSTSRRGEEDRRTLPSFLFLGDQIYVGAYAREQGALVPTKSVHSAKSWLSNPEVDRTAKVLPWDAQESRPRVFAGRCGGQISRSHARGLGHSATGCAAGAAGHRAHRARVFR